VCSWYESLRQTDGAGTQLRIDAGPPANGNGVIYTATETLRFREGKLASTGKGGNALLPLIEGVYVQPLERTMAELTPTGVDLERAVLPGRWEKRPVWIVGDWKAGVDLPDALFDTATFRSARHWAATDTPSGEEKAR
jgi:hypothetical protein